MTEKEPKTWIKSQRTPRTDQLRKFVHGLAMSIAYLLLWD